MKRFIVLFALLIPSVSFGATTLGFQAYSSATKVTCSAVSASGGNYVYGTEKHISLGTKGYGNYSSKYSGEVFVRCYQTLAPSTLAAVKSFVNNTAANYFPLTEKLFTNTK